MELDSILESIKSQLGISEGDETFDPEVTMHINTALMTLTQLGVGPSEGYYVSDASTTWSEFFRGDKFAAAAKTYVYIKVKLVFDPPSTTAVIDSMNKTANEIEWRLENRKNAISKEDNQNG